jgi:hypothetical protein
MSTRASAHAKEEKAIFDAFLVAYPSFAAQVSKFDQPDGPFPDVAAELIGGGLVDFELGEWLDGLQTGAAKRYDALAEAMTAAIGVQRENPSRHFRAVMLSPCDDAMRFEGADRAVFRTELWTLVAETHHRWPMERFWQSPQGRGCREFDRYPILGKYLRSVNFYPPVVGGKERRWPAGQPWIFVENRGGSYSPGTSLAALRGILVKKTTHYGAFSRPTRLIIYYGRAAAYNTPYIGVETRQFADVAGWAADAVRGQKVFEKVYLLNALQPGLEAFEIYPACLRCS